MDNRNISVKMRVVAFSDLPTVQEISYRQIGVGKMKLNNVRNINDNISKKEETSKQIVEKAVVKENGYTQEDLEREGNESLF